MGGTKSDEGRCAVLFQLMNKDVVVATYEEKSDSTIIAMRK